MFDNLLQKFVSMETCGFDIRKVVPSLQNTSEGWMKKQNISVLAEIFWCSHFCQKKKNWLQKIHKNKLFLFSLISTVGETPLLLFFFFNQLYSDSLVEFLTWLLTNHVTWGRASTRRKQTKQLLRVLSSSREPSICFFSLYWAGGISALGPQWASVTSVPWVIWINESILIFNNFESVKKCIL